MSARRTKRAPWIVAREGGAELECRRCGAVERVELPLSVTAWVARSRAFQAAHEGCEEKGER